jgi:hypothetical protein
LNIGQLVNLDVVLDGYAFSYDIDVGGVVGARDYKELILPFTSLVPIQVRRGGLFVFFGQDFLVERVFPQNFISEL